MAELVSSSSCLSVIELLSLLEPGGPPEAASHLRRCRRCAALAERLPRLKLDTVPPPTALPESIALQPRAHRPRPKQVSTGQLWIATSSPGGTEREVVAIVGRPPGDHDYVIVAPTSTEIHQATDTDLIVDDSPLGYPHLVSLANQGTMKRWQLVQYLGRVERSVRADIVALYRWLTGIGQEPELLTTKGPPILSSEDPRLGFRSLQAERLGSLWAAADAELAQEHEPLSEDEDVTLGRLVALELEGGAWDRSTLLEQSHVEGVHLDAVLADKLDLTQASDIPAVARIVSTLHIPDPLPAVAHALERSPGGLLVGGGTGERMAARSWHAVTPEQRTRDLLRGQYEVDDSPEGRKQAMAAYLRDLESELDAIQ